MMNCKQNDSLQDVDNLQLCDILHLSQCAPDEAKRLADLYTAIAQIYRKMAGLTPLATDRHQRAAAARQY